jgi:hypothetical protein
MRIWVSLIWAAAAGSFWASGASAQQEASTLGRVKARPTGIEVTSPLTDLKNETRVIEYVDRMLKDYDTNQDDFIDSTEWKEGRWSTPPEESDSNKDGKLSKGELQERIARRFGFVSAPAEAADAKPSSRKLIAFEIAVIDRAGVELAGEKNKSPTAAQLLQLEKDGKAQVQRLKLTALENVEARLQLGEDAPFISGRSSRGGGPGGGFPITESVTYNSLGTTLLLTAEAEADGKILASLNLARSTVAPPKAAEKVEGQETGVSGNYPRRLQNTIVTTIRVTPGETAVICGQQTHTGNSPSELWVLVTAKIE